MNPYWGADFFQFFLIFFKRMSAFVRGTLPLAELASDEVQVLALALLGGASAIIGTFLVLRKMTMLANSLSHTILLGIVIAYLATHALFRNAGSPFAFDLTTLLIAAFITALLTTLLTELIVKIFRVREDASIGLVFTSLFALGIVIVTLYTRNTHIGVEAIMGNVDALHVADLRLLGWIFLINTSVILLFSKPLQLITFDSCYSQTLGIAVTFFHYLIVILAATTVMGGFRAVGVVMILSLFTAPTLTARLITARLGSLIALSALITFVCALLSVALSRHLLSTLQLSLSTSGIFVTILTLFFIIVAIKREFLIRLRRRAPEGA